MLNSRDMLICALLAAAGLSLATTEARADLFDFLRPKREVVVARAQSPDGGYGAAAYQRPRGGWQPQTFTNNQNAPVPMAPRASDANVPSGWGNDAASPVSLGSSELSGAGLDVNCGECDRHQGRVSFCRKLCHQTYYPRAAPYCMPEWGWNQTCWRRMKDNYNCPRPDFHGSTPEPRLPLAPQIPVLPPATTYLPSPVPRSNQIVNYGQPARVFSARPTSQGQAPPRGPSQRGEISESESGAEEWNYEEITADQQIAAPGHQNDRARNYLLPGVRR